MRDMWRLRYHKIKDINFRDWCHKENNIIILMIFVIAFIIGGVLVYKSIKELRNADLNALLYIWLLSIYIFGCVYTLWNDIVSKSRKFQNALEENENNLELIIKNTDYISIGFCIAGVVRTVSPMIIVFMVNIVLKMSNIEQSGVEYVYMFTRILLTYGIIVSFAMVMFRGFRTTEIMIPLNTDSGIKRKVDKLTKKYQK